MNHFMFLGTNINFMLDYSTHIKAHIKEAKKSDGAMGFIWDAEEDVLKTKYKMCMAIFVNCDLKSFNTSTINRLKEC